MPEFLYMSRHVHLPRILDLRRDHHLRRHADLSRPVHMSGLCDLHRHHDLPQYTDMQSRLLSHDAGQLDLCRWIDVPRDHDLSGLLHLP